VGSFDAVVFAGGGCRCFWQAGFWSVAAPALSLSPRMVGAASAGSAIACAALTDRLESVLENFKQRAARNARNVYPRNGLLGEPVFPHEQIYRETILETIDESALQRLRHGPDLRVFLTQPPRWLGAASGVAAGILAYQLNRMTGGTIHPAWAKRLGFRGLVVSVRSCQTGGQLADLILQSSCTPPLLPVYRRDGRIVLDGGLVDNVPVDAVTGARSTLVLLTRPFPEAAIPDVPGRTYVQPSRPAPVAKWDYTSPGKVQETYDLGRRDGEAFARRWQREASHPLRSRSHDPEPRLLAS
jgi:predicted acylesterase/phospholipase RssA